MEPLLQCFLLLCVLAIENAVVRQLMKGVGRYIFYIPALIGVPIHELSHYITAILLGRKVTNVVFFQFSRNGALGYVEHTSKQTITSQIGDFLIGIAPLFGGVLSIVIVTNVLSPVVDMSTRDCLSLMSLHVWDLNSSVWVFICSSIAMFTFPSRTDLKVALPGAIYSVILLTLATIIFKGANAWVSPLNALANELIAPLMILNFSNAVVIFTFMLANGFKKVISAC